MNMCDTNPAAPSPSAKHVRVCVVPSHTSQHGSGAVIFASRKSATATESRNTGIETCCLVERRAPSGKRGAESSGRRWCQDCLEKRERSSRTVTAVRARSNVGNLCGYES